MSGWPQPSRPIQRITALRPCGWKPRLPPLPCSAGPPSRVFSGWSPRRTIFTAYRSEPITNRDALGALAAFAALPQVDLIDEPSGLESLWWRLAGLAEAAPKRWMDAYLAAFAISGSLRLISLDRDFQQFVDAGLDLLLLQADAGLAG